MIEPLFGIARGMDHRFPEGNEPFQIMPRLLEESGELAQQVNHFEDTGVKREKYGLPDRVKLAKEVMAVLRCAAQVAVYYGIEQEVEGLLDQSFQWLKSEGHILDGAVECVQATGLE
jgi:NTP pyrophosphatase (non-canonical NTP hydrolase)